MLVSGSGCQNTADRRSLSHSRRWVAKRSQNEKGWIWVFPKIVVPQNGWFIMENPIKMDDLGVPLFLETPIWYVKFFQRVQGTIFENLTTSTSGNIFWGMVSEIPDSCRIFTGICPRFTMMRVTDRMFTCSGHKNLDFSKSIGGRSHIPNILPPLVNNQCPPWSYKTLCHVCLKKLDWTGPQIQPTSSDSSVIY